MSPSMAVGSDRTSRYAGPPRPALCTAPSCRGLGTHGSLRVRDEPSYAGGPGLTVGCPTVPVVTAQVVAAAVDGGSVAAITGASGVLAAVLGAGWFGTWLKLRAERRKGLAGDVKAAQDALQQVRAVLRQRARDAREVSDEELAQRLDDLDTSVYRTGCEAVVDASRAYAQVGQDYASGDPDTSVAQEQAAYDRVAKALMVELERNR